MFSKISTIPYQLYKSVMFTAFSNAHSRKVLDSMLVNEVGTVTPSINEQFEKAFSPILVIKKIAVKYDIRRQTVEKRSKTEHQDQMEIARARLELDKDRLDPDKQKAEVFNKNEPCQIGIVVLPEIKDESPETAAKRAAE